MKKITCVFFGTPQLSADILNFLHTKSEVIEILAVVTNPDQIAGRGHELITSPVGQYAKTHHIPLLQPEKIRNNEEFFASIRAMKPDICIVVAYGKILPQILIDIPLMGFLNVHTSLLPKYRGAAPIQYALLNGEKTTGLTVQQMSLGMDEGDILVQEVWDVEPSDTTGKLFEKTGVRAGPLLIEAITGIHDKTITPRPQRHEEASYTKMIDKKEGELETSWTILEAYNRWQAYTPWPGLYTFFGETKVTLLEIEMVKNPHSEEQNTQDMTPLFYELSHLPAIKLRDGYILIKKIHPAGKKPMSGEDFVRGYRGIGTWGSMEDIVK